MQPQIPCLQCPSGTFSDEQSTSCAVCPFGRFDHDDNASTACAFVMSTTLTFTTPYCQALRQEHFESMQEEFEHVHAQNSLHVFPDGTTVTSGLCSSTRRRMEEHVSVQVDISSTMFVAGQVSALFDKVFDLELARGQIFNDMNSHNGTFHQNLNAMDHIEFVGSTELHHHHWSAVPCMFTCGLLSNSSAKFFDGATKSCDNQPNAMVCASDDASGIRYGGCVDKKCDIHFSYSCMRNGVPHNCSGSGVNLIAPVCVERLGCRTRCECPGGAELNLGLGQPNASSGSLAMALLTVALGILGTIITVLMFWHCGYKLKYGGASYRIKPVMDEPIEVESAEQVAVVVKSAAAKYKATQLHDCAADQSYHRSRSLVPLVASPPRPPRPRPFQYGGNIVRELTSAHIGLAGDDAYTKDAMVVESKAEPAQQKAAQQIAQQEDAAEVKITEHLATTDANAVTAQQNTTKELAPAVAKDLVQAVKPVQVATFETKVHYLKNANMIVPQDIHAPEPEPETHQPEHQDGSTRHPLEGILRPKLELVSRNLLTEFTKISIHEQVAAHHRADVEQRMAIAETKHEDDYLHLLVQQLEHNTVVKRQQDTWQDSQSHSIQPPQISAVVKEQTSQTEIEPPEPGHEIIAEDSAEADVQIREPETKLKIERTQPGEAPVPEQETPMTATKFNTDAAATWWVKPVAKDSNEVNARIQELETQLELERKKTDEARARAEMMALGAAGRTLVLLKTDTTCLRSGRPVWTRLAARAP